MHRLRTEHLITAAVAAGCFGLALAGGGFEPTAYAVAGLAIWAAVVAVLATGIAPRAEPPRAALAAGLCLGAFTALIAISLAWASDDGGGFDDVVRALVYLGAFVLVVLGSRRGGARAWLLGLAIALAAIGALALFARFVPGPFGSPDADLAADLPAALGRLTYPIGYWNGLAAAMAAAVALLGWLGGRGETRAGRAVAVGALPAVLLALWTTDSRGGIIAALLACAILIGVGPARSRTLASLVLGAIGGLVAIAFALGHDELFQRPGTELARDQGTEMLALTLLVALATGLTRYALDRRCAELAIPRLAGRRAAVVAGIVAMAAIVVANPVQRFEDFKAPPQGTEIGSGTADLLRSGSSGRYQFWQTALDGYASAPVGGLGTGGYGRYWLEHREYPIPATRAHSLLLESLAELGLAGLGLIVAFFAIGVLAGVERLRERERSLELAPALAVLGVGIAAAAVDWTWDLPGVFVSTVAAAALLTGPATLPAGPPGGPGVAQGTVRSRRRFSGGVAVLVIAWVSICASGLLLLADHALESSRAELARGDVGQAIGSANDAIDLEPWAADAREQLALSEERAGDIPTAQEAIEQAIARARDDFQLWLVKARLEARAGDTGAARASLLRAHQLNPLDPSILALVAESQAPAAPAPDASSE